MEVFTEKMEPAIQSMKQLTFLMKFHRSLHPEVVAEAKKTLVMIQEICRLSKLDTEQVEKEAMAEKPTPAAMASEPKPMPMAEETKTPAEPVKKAKKKATKKKSFAESI